MDYPCRERKIKRMQQLRARLAAQPETISDFTFAANEKYWEGMELAMAGRGAAAIYLMGYAAEMLLKAAAFRFDGAAPSDLVTPLLAPAKNWMRRRFAIKPEAYHSLRFWTVYLRSRRLAALRPLATDLDRDLNRRVRRLYRIWWVEMRYRTDQASEAEVERVYRDVTWLLDHFNLIWR